MIFLLIYSFRIRLIFFVKLIKSQNSHAYVNASFRAGVSADRSKFSDQISIVYGNISDKFDHAFATEKILAGKTIDQSTFKSNIYFFIVL